MVTAHDVARELRQHQHIPRVRLQKLLYYCQGWHLALYDEPLFEDPIEAWEKGPVVRTVWRTEEHGDPAPPEVALPESGRHVVEFVLGRYGATTGVDLINQTHNEMPWRLARDKGRKTVLTHDLLRQYFVNEPETQASLRALRLIKGNPAIKQRVDDALHSEAPKSADSREAITQYRRRLLAES